jgi:hypothetical protein
MSVNPEISLETLQRYEHHWNWERLSANQSFKWDWVRAFPYKPWDWTILSHKILSVETILEFPDKPWDWMILTFHDTTSFKNIVDNPALPWEISELFFENIGPDEISLIRTFRSHYDEDDWIDHSSRAEWNIVRNNLDLPWSFINIKFGEDPPNDIGDIIKFPINYIKLSRVVSFGDVEKNMGAPWSYDIISKRATIDDTKKYPKIPWNYNFVTEEPVQNVIRRWVAAKRIQTQFRRANSDPSYKICRNRLNHEFGTLTINGS